MNVPVTYQSRELTLQVALPLLLDRFELTYAVENGVLLITTRKARPAAKKDASSPPDADDSAGFRTWTDRSGKYTVEAQLVGSAGGEVVLKKRDGTTIKIPVAKLSKSDQKWLQDQ